jgi:hypothetical protein
MNDQAPIEKNLLTSNVRYNSFLTSPRRLNENSNMDMKQVLQNMGIYREYPGL